MSVIRPFEATDVLRFTAVQADPWTATYHNGYYSSYLAQWPDFCVAASGAFDNDVGAYSEWDSLIASIPCGLASRRAGNLAKPSRALRPHPR